MSKTPKRPRDVNELAAMIGKLATHEIEEAPAEPETAASRRGKARAQSLTATRRKAIAKNAAAARWKRKGTA